jgi:hypothetical protein
MKKLIGIIIASILMTASVSFGAACTQTVTAYGTNMKELTFTCTAVATAFASTTLSASNLTAIKGYYITEVYSFPGGTPPTEASAFTLKTADPIGFDVLGGTGVVSATLAKRFLPTVTLPAGSVAANTVRNALTLAITGNSVATGIVIIKVILWNN